MTDAVPFQTRARTIDHLGREQIADVPTAVSELWKNSYDAYAKNVALHIFGGGNPVAAIFDDGHGMTYEQFIQRWLVVGTESKTSEEAIEFELRKGLAERPKQGQKGIGRLSVAALGSCVLVLTKQENGPLVACVIDWRLFENPYLFLQDVKLPVIPLSDFSELATQLPLMKEQLLENLYGDDGPPDRTARLKGAWDSYKQIEKLRGIPTSTAEEIEKLFIDHDDLKTYLAEWRVYRGESNSGTAMLMFNINSSLAAWVTDDRMVESDEILAIQASLKRTLTGFSDPFSENKQETVDYQVVIHKHGEKKTVIGREDGYGIDFLRSLEHCIEGSFDEHGVFKGRLRAFGKDFGEIEIIPTTPPPTSTRERVGPFSVSIGAFEGDAKSSTHSPEIYSKIDERGDTHGGLYLYRDGLRVMPYGRPENDFFKIEERRTSKAGREFWSSRKLFGRIVTTRKFNSNLRDKAGREGLIDNASSRTLQVLIIDLLKTTARRYFGGDSTIRDELLPGIKAENILALKKAKAASKSQLSSFKSAVNVGLPLLASATASLEAVSTTLKEIIKQSDAAALWLLHEKIDDLVTMRSELLLPPRPKNLGKFEKTYISYRDAYAYFAASIAELRKVWSSETERLRAKPSIDVARSRFGSNQKAVLDKLSRWGKGTVDLLKSEISRVELEIEKDRKMFYKMAAPLLDDVEDGRTTLGVALAEMDNIRDKLTDELSQNYDPYYRSILHLSEGIDLDGAFAYSGARTETLEKKVEQIQGLAQIGISVEILSHELDALDRRLASGLAAMPSVVRASTEFSRVDTARRELVERLRFLSQMQISVGDIKKKISGLDIFEYLLSFFATILTRRGITLSIAPELEKAAFYEFPSRIYPVFINLVNNSLYWISNAKDKEIRLDVQQDCIMVSDSGPGIDADDVPNLFELFFTRRLRGRGVGLFLCRQTLSSGGHSIEYVTEKSIKILPGANFSIKLRNGFDA